MFSRLFTSCLICCLAFSCTEEEPTFLSNEKIAALDSMLTVAIPVEREREDSICKANFDVRLRHIVDSLLIARREEEARLRQIVPGR